MSRKILCLFLFSALSLLAFAQTNMERMNWYFGDKAGLIFKSDPPTFLTDSKMSTVEASAVGSDRFGKLLFYSNSKIIWNRFHEPMPNGSDLKGHESSSQGAVIVPHPRDSSIYYIFTTEMSAPADLGGMYYSEIDMKLDGGRGDINPSKKNILLFSGSTEKIATVQHANGIDIWVAGRHHNGEFVVYLINSLGVEESNPRLSNLGMNISNPYDAVGCMNFSPDGKRLACVLSGHGLFEYMDFNSKTGELSNYRKMQVDDRFLYGVLFSRNSRYLYVSGKNRLDNRGEIIQFDTYIPKDSLMLAEGKSMLFGATNASIGGLQWAPGGAIYGSNQLGRYLCKIPYPDKAYPYCAFQDSLLKFPTQPMMIGLPQLLEYSNQRFRFTDHSECNEKYTVFQFYDMLNDPAVNMIEWNFGNSITMIQTRGPSGWDQILHFYSKPGEHIVKVRVFYNSKVEVIQRSVFVRKPTLSTWGDTIKLCENSVYWLEPGGSEEYKYSWQDGSDSSVYKVSKAGLYWVIIDNGYCLARDSFMVIQDSARFKVDLGRDTFMCNNETFILDAGYDNATYSWQDGKTGKTYKTNVDGVYWVTVTRQGFYCPAADTIWLRHKDRPYIELGADRIVCTGDSAVFNLKGKKYSFVQWQDGSRDSVYKPAVDGEYKVTVKDQYCFAWDSINLDFHSKNDPGFDDYYEFCKGDSVSFDLNGFADSAFWNNGFAMNYKSHSAEFVRYRYKQEQCWYKDSLEIFVHSFPKFDIRDTVLCKDDEVKLKPGVPKATISWFNGSTDTTLVINDWGTYSVSVQNLCGTFTDSFSISDCFCRFYVPNAFSPDKDGINDHFKAVGCAAKIFSMQIYNRWGELVFETNDPLQSWDGNYRGSYAPEGVYLWQIEYSETPKLNRTNRHMRGTVALLR